MSCYGYTERTAPNIDELSTSAVQFDREISPSDWTLPVFASILTGAYPSSNAVGQNVVNLPIIMEVLRTRGYKSIVVTDNYFVEPLCKQSDDLVYITPDQVRERSMSSQDSPRFTSKGYASRTSLRNIAAPVPIRDLGPNEFCITENSS